MTSQYYSGSISGGASGGYLSLEKYGDGVLSKEKALLIRNIAEDLSTVMKVNKYSDSMSIEEVIKRLKSVLPSIDKNGKSNLTSKSAEHERVCKVLAESINKRYGKSIVDLSATPNEICEHVAEVMYSLFSGLKSEFVGISVDIKRIMNNIAIIKNTLESGFNKLNSVVQESDNATLARQSAGIKSLYSDLQKELDRQLAVLNNLLDTTMDPTTKTIADMDSKNNQFKHIMTSLKTDLGTADMSKKLTYLLSGVNSVASMSHTVDKALKDVGVSVDNYKSSKNTNELIDMAYEVWQKHHSHPNANEVAKFISAIEVIRDHDYAHDDIAAYLSGKKPSRQPQLSSKKGGADGANSLEKRLERQTKTREILFKDFNHRLEQQNKQIKLALAKLMPRFGQSIDIDDHLNEFVKAFENLTNEGELDRENFYLALTGYRTDAVSKDERARYLGKLEAISKSLKPLTSGSNGDYFRTVKDAIDEEIKIIDTFTDTFLKPATSLLAKEPQTRGGANNRKQNNYNIVNEDESSTDEDEESVDGGDRNEDMFEHKYIDNDEKREDNIVGAGLFDNAQDTLHNFAEKAEDTLAKSKNLASKVEQRFQELSDEAKAIIKNGGFDNGAYVTLKQLAYELAFYYKRAQMERSLKIASKDIQSFGQDYKVILGDAVSALVLKIKTDGDTWISTYDSTTTPEGKIVNEWIRFAGDNSYVPGVAIPSSYDFSTSATIMGDNRTDYKEYRESCKAAAIKFKKLQVEVQTEMLKTTEAIDIYLMNFADAVANNPQDIKDLPELLKSVHIVGKWFSEGSGNNLCDLFESWPSYLIESSPHYASEKYDPSSGEHYFDWVGRLVSKAAAGGGSLPANPFIGVLPGQMKGQDQSFIDAVLDKAKKTMMTTRSLDNILSTFTYLGSKFGNKNIQSFMTTGMMLKNIRRYIYVSAIVMGFTDAAGHAAVYNKNIVSSVDVNGSAYGQANTDSVSQRSGIPIQTGVSVHGIPATNAVAVPNVNPNDNDLDRWVKSKFSVAMTSINDAAGGKLNKFEDTWRITDEIFVMSMKAMVAKIFTVIGTYGVFNKPLAKYSSLSSVRMILGGGSSVPEIIPGATELYLRLVLLAEFYRDVMKFSSDVDTAEQAQLNATGDRRITLVPDFDGIWQGFFKIIFDDAKFVTQGNYSDTQVNTIITEINNIYKKFKTSTDRSTVVDVVQHFIAEINRRYGVVKQKEIGKYIKDKQHYLNTEEYNADEQFNYNLLDEDDQHGRMPAPSDSFDTYVRPTKPRTAIDNPYSNELVRLIYNFRSDIDTHIKQLIPSSGPNGFSFDESIRQYKQQIEQAKDNGERYKIVLRALQGNEQLSVVGNYKAVMFHETVQAPLDTLYSIWGILNTFARKVQAFDIEKIEKAIDAVLTVGGTGRLAGAAGANAVTYCDFAKEMQKAKVGLEKYLHPGYLPDVETHNGGINSVYHSWTRATTNPTPAVGGPLQSDVDEKGAYSNILVYRGIYGVEPHAYQVGGQNRFAHHLTWETIGILAKSVSAAGTAADVKENIKEGIKRFVIDREELLKDLLNILYALSSDFNDLVTVKVQGSNLILDFANLTDLVSNMMVQIRKNIERFRGQVDDALIKKVEGGVVSKKSNNTGGVNRTVGSLSWLEEQLLERLLKGSREGGEFKQGTFVPNSLSHITEMLDKTYKNLTKKYNVLARIEGNKFATPVERGDTNGDKALAEYEKTLLVNSYDLPISELLFWNPNSQVQGNTTGAATVFNGARAGGNPGNVPLSVCVTDINRTHSLLNNQQVRNSANDWPFQVIPSIDNLNSDDDLKVYKELGLRLEAFKNDYFKIAQQIHNSGAAGLALIPVDPLNQAPAIAAGIALDSLFIIEGTAIHVTYDDIKTTAHRFEDPDTFSTTLNFTNFAAANAQLAKNLISVMKAYNAEFNKREELLKSSLRTPIVGRALWYEDPKDTEYMIGQSYLNEAKLDIGFEAGLLVRLNQLLSRYLYLGWDATSKKMYRGLIDKFANGTHSASVINGQALNDIDLTYIPHRGQRSTKVGTPPQHVTIFASLCRFMRNVLMCTKKSSNDPEYRQDTLMDVPIHMKESYRSGLVAFDKLFKLVIKKSEMIKSVSQNLNLTRQIAYLDSYGLINDCSANGAVAGVNAALLSYYNAGAYTNAVVATGVNRWDTYGNLYPRHNAKLVNKDDYIHLPSGMRFRGLTGMGVPNAVGMIGTAWLTGLLAGDTNKEFESRYNNWLVNSVPNRSETNAYVRFAAYEGLNKEKGQQWTIALIDDIINTSLSLSKCAMETYREIADEPKYFETHEGFIIDYTNSNKNAPLMLQSEQQILLRNRYSYSSKNDPNGTEFEWDSNLNTGYARANYLLPFHRNGTQPHKFLYGVRLTLNRPDVKLSLEYMPGMQTALEKYNGICIPDARMDKGEYEKFIVAHNDLLRYLADLKFYKPLLDTGNGGFTPSNYEGWTWIDAAGNNVYNPFAGGREEARLAASLFDVPLSISENTTLWPTNTIHLPKEQRDFAMKSTLDEIIDLTESSNQEESIKKLLLSIATKSTSGLDNRKNARIYNIIDLNVVPINVHALVRDVPYAPTINYAYSCDRLIQDHLLPHGITDHNNEDHKLYPTTQEAKNTNQLMCKMLMDPYVSLTNTEYFGLFQRIVTGDNGLGLDRPKYISDQLWNKVLFGDQYQMPHTNSKPDESGPRSDNAQVRALQNLLNNPNAFVGITIQKTRVYNALFPFLQNNGATDNWLNRTISDANASAIITYLINGFADDNRLRFPANISQNRVIIDTIKSSVPLVQQAIRRATMAAIPNALSNINPGNINGVITANIPGTFANDFQGVLRVAINPLNAAALREFEPLFRNVHTEYNRMIAARSGRPGFNGTELIDLILGVLLHNIIYEYVKTLPIVEQKESENNGVLQYITEGDEKDDMIKQVSLGTSAAAVRHDLSTLGKLRFDTKFVRDNLFVIQLQRLMRLVMRNEVDTLGGPVVSDTAVMNRQITEYIANEKFNGQVFRQA